MQYYDPRVWIRKSEEAAVTRLGEVFLFTKIYMFLCILLSAEGDHYWARCTPCERLRTDCCLTPQTKKKTFAQQTYDDLNCKGVLE